MSDSDDFEVDGSKKISSGLKCPKCQSTNIKISFRYSTDHNTGGVSVCKDCSHTFHDDLGVKQNKKDQDDSDDIGVDEFDLFG